MRETAVRQPRGVGAVVWKRNMVLGGWLWMTYLLCKSLKT